MPKYRSTTIASEFLDGEWVRKHREVTAIQYTDDNLAAVRRFVRRWAEVEETREELEAAEGEEYVAVAMTISPHGADPIVAAPSDWIVFGVNGILSRYEDEFFQRDFVPVEGG